VWTRYRSPTSRNYRTLINLKNVDVCPILKAAHKFPQFVGYYKFFKMAFPGFVHPCPYRNISVFNASIPRIDENSLKNYASTPNGFSKGKI
jgi:hypothetical protein